MKKFISRDINERPIWCLLFLGNLLAFLGFQTLIFWIGKQFQTVENLGLYLNMGLAVLMWLPVLTLIKKMYCRHTSYALLFICGAGGFYVAMTLYFSWWLVIVSLFCIALGIMKSVEDDTNIYVLCGSLGYYLLYASCAWGAMIIMGLTPAASIIQWGLLVAITLITWSIPLFNKENAA